MTSRPLIYVVAGEPSGDVLGGRLMSALRRQSDKVEFSGVGGEQKRASIAEYWTAIHQVARNKTQE